MFQASFDSFAQSSSGSFFSSESFASSSSFCSSLAGSQEQKAEAAVSDGAEMFAPVSDGAEMFAPCSAPVVKTEPAAPAAPAACEDSTSPSEIGTTPSCASVIELVISSSCGSTPAELGEGSTPASSRVEPSPFESDSPMVSAVRSEELAEINPVVKNVSYKFCVDLKRQLNVERIAANMKNVDWCPSRSRAMVRLTRSGVIGTICSKGTVFIEGCESKKEGQKVMAAFIRQMRRADPSLASCKVNKMRTVEVDARCDLGFQVNMLALERITDDDVRCVNLDMNRSSGVSVYLLNPESTVTLYQSGKCRIRGIKCSEDLETAAGILCRLADKCKLADSLMF